MTSNIINGYVLVDWSAACSRYRGVDCDPWEYFSARYYTGELSSLEKALFDEVECDESNGFWWGAANDLNVALLLADISRRAGRNDVLLAIFSPYLANAYGRTGWEESGVKFLGYDLVSIGEWSLLHQLLDLQVDLPKEVYPALNENGLLRDSSYSGILERFYRDQAADNIVEPIGDIDCGVGVEPVSVYLLQRVQNQWAYLAFRERNSEIPKEH